MKFPGKPGRRCWRIVLGALALPPFLWAITLAILPTDRFRACISERLSASSGRTVEIGGLRIGFLGGVSLREVRIGAPESPGDPWLVVRRAAIDVSLLQLLYGKIEPTRIEIEGLDLRVLRHQDGTLEISDLLVPTTPRPSGAHRDEAEAEDDPIGLVVWIRQGRLHLIDEPTGSRLDFVDVEGRAECRGPQTVVQELSGVVNGGPFRFSGHFRKDPQTPSFSGRLTAERVALRDGMSALGYLVPVFSGSEAQLEGRLSLDLALAGEGARRETITRTLHGRGRVELDPILLDHSKLLAEFGRFIELPPKGRVGAVRSALEIGGGRVSNEHLTIDVGRVPVVLTGSTTFDGQLDYRLRGDALTERIPTKARNYLKELEIDLDHLADVRVEGTVDDMIVKVNGQAVVGERPAPGSDPAEKFREIGRRIRDRIRR